MELRQMAVQTEFRRLQIDLSPRVDVEQRLEYEQSESRWRHKFGAAQLGAILMGSGGDHDSTAARCRSHFLQVPHAWEGWAWMYYTCITRGPPPLGTGGSGSAGTGRDGWHLVASV